MSHFHFRLGVNWMGRESSPGDKRILKPTIPGSQGQASSTPTHSVLQKLEFVLE